MNAARNILIGSRCLSSVCANPSPEYARSAPQGAKTSSHDRIRTVRAAARSAIYKIRKQVSLYDDLLSNTSLVHNV